MSPVLRNALVAGVLAGIIYTVIATSTGTAFGAAAARGLYYLTGAVVFVISTLVSRSKGTRRP